MKLSLRYAALCLVTLVFATPAHADIINFDSYADGTAITNQYAGVTFTNTLVLTSGISLNELEFPPYSGQNVVTDNGGPISITFSAPVSTVGGYFTYAEMVSLQAFGAGNTLVASTTSLFSQNFISSGNDPNEFLQLTFAGGISELTITGDPKGGSLTLDNLTYAAASPTTVTPEPATLSLLLTGLAFAGAWKRPTNR